MSEVMEIYRCNICGNTVEVIKNGAGELVCCGMPMELLKEKYDESGKEIHLPVIEQRENKTFIKVGENFHPSETQHYIECIEVISKDKKYIKRKFLNPGDVPELELKPKYDNIICRSLCNIHGLWKNES